MHRLWIGRLALDSRAESERNWYKRGNSIPHPRSAMNAEIASRYDFPFIANYRNIGRADPGGP